MLLDLFGVWVLVLDREGGVGVLLHLFLHFWCDLSSKCSSGVGSSTQEEEGEKGTQIQAKDWRTAGNEREL